jgi:hypothetical protein
MQKVISINVFSNSENEDREAVNFKEFEFPELNKYLDDGYEVEQFYQVATSNNRSNATLTFILKKELPTPSPFS